VKKILNKGIKNKHGQVGETLTWVIATIIILIVLIVFVYASIGLAKSKNIASSKTSSGKLGSSQGDWIDLKNSLAYSLNNKNQKNIERWINAQEE
jgi:hypothetical protein